MSKSLELEYRDTLREAIKIWGVPSQIGMFHEEIGELLQAVNKFDRKGDWESRDNLMEEIADVEIMIEQLKLIMKSNANAGVHVHKRKKLIRLKERIEKYKSDQNK